MASLTGRLNRASLMSLEAWRRRAAAVGRRLHWPWTPNSEAGPDFSRRAAYLYLALFVPALATIVLSNWRWNALVNDTLLLVSSFEMLERFSSLFSNANANPLQALFDIFPSGLRLDTIPNLVGRALLGPGMHVDFFYACSGVFLAFAVAAMARSAGLRWGVAVLAGMMLPLLILPTFGMFPLADHFYILWPIFYYSAAGAVLVTALFWRIDGRRWSSSAARSVIAFLILLHLSMIQILFMTLLAPAIAAMGIGALAASENRRELLAKLACAAAIILGLAVAGIFHYLYAIGVNTASHVFYQELLDFMQFSGPSLSVFLDDFGYVIKNPFTYSYHGSANLDGALVPLSQLGAIHLAIFGTTRKARIFGRTVVLWVLATAVLIAILHYFFYYTGFIYQGPDPRHLVHILWPYYIICLASLFFTLAQAGVTLLARVWPKARSISPYLPHALVLAVLAGPVSYLAAPHVLRLLSPDQTPRPAIFLTYLPYFHSFKTTPITDYLQSNVGVSLDREFRGSAVEMPSDYTKDVSPYKAWRRETTFAYTRAYLATDGAFALRHFNIPTLDQFTHNVTPQFYLTVRELLSRPGIDVFDKHFALVTRLNEPIMSLLGLRYIIADYELPFGTQRLEMPIPDEARKVLESQSLLKSPLRVYELPHPNLGNYSPTEVVHARTAEATLLAMLNTSFDGRKTVLTDDESIGVHLVPATDATMTVRLGGVSLRAKSPGDSVLVLPVQYSHCWQVVSGNAPQLFRANLMQLGVRFSGELQVELQQVFGPFWQSSCRLADAEDAHRLRMVEAVGIAEELQRTPGDGRNVIASAESLDTAISPSTIATVTPVAATSGPAREFKVTALGNRTEHYAVLGLSDLAPGVYTLSLQVRGDNSAGLALQLKDAAGNGAYADYILPTATAWAYRLGKSEKAGAKIRKIDDQWYQIRLTAAVSEAKGQIFFHVKNRRNGAYFSAGGEAIMIRGVKLERGETATPYPGLGG